MVRQLFLVINFKISYRIDKFFSWLTVLAFEFPKTYLRLQVYVPVSFNFLCFYLYSLAHVPDFNRTLLKGPSHQFISSLKLYVKEA